VSVNNPGSSGSVAAYQSYVALIIQSGTPLEDPTVTVLENTLGGTPVWTATATGTYIAHLAGAFPGNRTWLNPCSSVVIDQDALVSKYMTIQATGDDITIQLWDETFNTLQDGLNILHLEIRVYPAAA
jgi:hypothetical protein